MHGEKQLINMIEDFTFNEGRASKMSYETMIFILNQNPISLNYEAMIFILNLYPISLSFFGEFCYLT